MKQARTVDNEHASAVSVPDVMATDDVAMSSGASIVVAVAATIAVILTLVVATLSTSAHAATGVDARDWTSATAQVAGSTVEGIKDRKVAGTRDVAFLVAETTSVRPAFRVAPTNAASAPAKSTMMTVVALGMFAMTAISTYLWRAFGRSLLRPAPIARNHRRRSGQ